jgi:hypothetical protein
MQNIPWMAREAELKFEIARLEAELHQVKMIVAKRVMNDHATLLEKLTDHVKGED